MYRSCRYKTTIQKAFKARFAGADLNAVVLFRKSVPSLTIRIANSAIE
jgi:hypothetical protein